MTEAEEREPKIDPPKPAQPEPEPPRSGSTLKQRLERGFIAAWRVLRPFFDIPFAQTIVMTIFGLVVGWYLARATPPPPEIEALIHEEARLALESTRTAEVVAEYSALFADKASIADANPNRIDGETYGWINKPEITQRFVNLQAFDRLKHELVSDIHVFNDRATAVTATDFRIVDQFPHKSFELWTFIKDGRHWKISSLTFNLPFTPPR